MASLYIIICICKYTQSYRHSLNVNRALRNIRQSHHHLSKICNSLHTGEKSRTFGKNIEHLKEPSPIYKHSNQSGHSINPDNFTIIRRDHHGLARTIRNQFTFESTTPHSTGKWVSITFIIYGTESCLTPLTLKLVMTMGMCTEHLSVGMFSPFQPIGMHIEQ